MDFLGKNITFIRSLLLFLFLFFLVKMIFPIAVFAQSATSSVSCDVSNVFEYVAPGSSGQQPSIQASVFMQDGTAHVGDVQNSVTWLNATTFRQNSGSGSFIYQINGNAVNFVRDNVWDGVMCTNPSGVKAIYEVRDQQGRRGALRYNNHMTCNSPVSSVQTIKTYEQIPGNGDTGISPPTTACVVDGQSNQTTNTSVQLIYQGKAVCNPSSNGSTPFDVIVFNNVGGAGAGEGYVYVKGRGLAAFYQILDTKISGNDPNKWNETTDVCNLTSSTTKKTADYFEYNIQRAKPDQLKDTFFKDYSVSCMPKLQYQISPQGFDKCSNGAACDQNGHGPWDVSGDLHLTSDGKLFGLFRNEALASARSNSKAPVTNRFESLETYLSVRNPSSLQSASQPITNPTVVDLSVKQSPLYKMTTLTEQCVFIKEKLKSVKKLCSASNRIEGDTTGCSLNGPIPGTDYNSHIALLNDIENKECSSIMEADVSDVANEKLKKAVLAVNPSMETAYRPAFIVAVTDFHTMNQDVTTDVPGQPQTGDFTTIDYMEVKVPAFGSDFTSDDTLGPGNYRDPLLLTADVLRQTNVQDAVKKDEMDQRAKIKSAAASLGIKGSQFFVGQSSYLPAFCKDDTGKLVICSALQNPLPPSLLSFVNADIASKVNQTGLPDLPCEANEPDFYSPENAKKIAEQVHQQLGSNLTPIDVGNYKKQKDLTVSIHAHVKDAMKGLNVNTRTQLYFVSPHNYGLQYVQKSFLSFLSLDSQKLLDAGVLLNGSLDQSKFSPLLQTDLGKPFQSGKSVKEGYSRALPPLFPGASPVPGNKFDYGVSIESANQSSNTSLFWNFAGQVASLPTRLMALLSSAKDSALNIYTQSCSGQYATEDWFLGHCSGGTTNSSPLPSSSPPAVADQYCIDWEMKTLSADQKKTLASNARSYLMSLPYSSDQNPVFLDAVKQKNFSGPNGPIPADKVNYYENYNGGGRSLLWTISDQCNNQTCFDYIIAGCMEKGFNPALCISMNLSESGGSNQIRFAPPKAASDFGCLLAERNNVASGLQCLTDKFFNQYKGLDYNQLFLKFAGDNGLTSSSYSRIKEFYTLLSSGVGITNGACAK